MDLYTLLMDLYTLLRDLLDPWKIRRPKRTWKSHPVWNPENCFEPKLHDFGWVPIFVKNFVGGEFTFMIKSWPWVVVSKFFTRLPPQKSNELIPKMVIFKGSRYRLSKAHHFGYPAVSFRECTPTLWGNDPIWRLRIFFIPGLVATTT